MAVYTHLGAEDLARLIAQYDVGDLVMAKGIAEAALGAKGDLDKLGNAIDPEWTGALPVSVLIGPGGKNIKAADAARTVTSSAPVTGSAVPGTCGAPARCAMWRAETLSPRERMASGGGPIQVRPALATASAKAAFSEQPESWKQIVRDAYAQCVKALRAAAPAPVPPAPAAFTAPPAPAPPAPRQTPLGSKPKRDWQSPDQHVWRPAPPFQ